MKLALVVAILCFLSLPVGAQANVSWVRDYATTLGTAMGSGALDGSDGFLWDLDGDGAEELVTFTADRVLILRSDDTPYLFLDGPGSNVWKRRKPLVVRVGTNQYVLVKSSPDCAAAYCTGRQIDVVSLFDDAVTSVGQVLVSAPFAGGGGDDRVHALLTPGIAAVDPGSSLLLVAVSSAICHVRTYDLAVGPSGVVSLTPIAQRPCPTSQTIAGNGASLYEIHDVNGQNPEPFLFATDILRLGDLTTAASWVATNGTTVPNRQGGSYTMSWDYGAQHVDSTVVVNRGSGAMPDYWVYALAEDGRTFAAQLVKSAAGALTLTPVFGTWSGNHQQYQWGPGAESLAVGRVRGLANPRVICNGRYVFDLDGQILADMNGQVTDPALRRYVQLPELWWTSPAGALVIDPNYAFEVQANALVQVAPTTTAASRPYSGTIHYQLWDWQPGLAWSRPASFKEGYPHLARPVIHVSASGSVTERLLVFRTSQAASILRASHELPLSPGPLSPLQRDQLLAHTQEAHLMRASDTQWLAEALGL